MVHQKVHERLYFKANQQSLKLEELRIKRAHETFENEMKSCSFVPENFSA